MNVDPHLHLHAHVELDRSCNRCSRCCLPKQRRVKSISTPTLFDKNALPVDTDEDKIKFYLRLKGIIKKRFAEYPFTENYMFDLVQLRSRVTISPETIPTIDDIDRIFEAIDDISQILKNSDFKELESQFLSVDSVRVKRRSI